MAEIRVERKSGGHTWMWVLLALALLMLAALMFSRRNTTTTTTTRPASVSSADMVAEVPVQLALVTVLETQEA